MPENLKALMVIILLGQIGFFISKKIIPNELLDNNIKSLRNVWLMVIITAFLSYNFWLFLILSSFIVSKFTKNVSNKVTVFFILVFTIPNLSSDISGLGVLNYFFTLSYPRFISLFVLLPAAFFISKNNKNKFLSLLPDKFLMMYILISVLLSLRNTTFTDALRELLYGYTDTFLPYYVASRGIKNLHEMNDAMHSFVTIALITSLFAIFEYSKSWLLFSTLGSTLGTGNDMTGYLLRAGDVRAVATMSHALILGSFLGVAVNYYFYMANLAKSMFLNISVFMILILGVFVTLSRGPWLATTASFIIFTLLGQKAFKKLVLFFMLSILCFAALSALPNGEKYINLLPWYNSESKNSNEQFNVEYRENLFENSITVINRSPFFGSTDYWAQPEMQELIQGEGIIDIVNTYIAVALEMGYIGLIIFLGVFFSVLFGIKLKMKKIKNKTSTIYILGASLMSAILAFMLLITATSFISGMPFICWSILGLGVAYTSVVNDYIKSQAIGTLPVLKSGDSYKFTR